MLELIFTIYKTQKFKMILQLREAINHFFGYVSVYRILGFIPLGMLLHISISTIITILLLKRGMKFKHVCLIVFLIGLSKEIFDSFVLNDRPIKHLYDMTYDMSYPIFLYLSEKIKLVIGKTKAKANEKNEI